MERRRNIRGSIRYSNGLLVGEDSELHDDIASAWEPEHLKEFIKVNELDIKRK